MKDFKGRTALITGAGNGFGVEFAKEAAGRGMNLVLVDIQKADVEQTLASCKELGAEGIALALDVSLYPNVQSMVKTAVDTYGTIDLLINNAGVAIGGLVWETPVQDYEWATSLNVFAQVYALHEVMPIMLKQGTECHIVNVASAAGLITPPFLSAYTMTKHASVALSESVNYDLQVIGSKIGMSVYCPGYIQTNLYNYEQNRPERFAKGDDPYYQSDAYKKALQEAKDRITGGVPIDDTGKDVFKAIEENQFYIVPHSVYVPLIQSRQNDIVEKHNPDIRVLLQSR